MTKRFITLGLLILFTLGVKGVFGQAMHINLKDGTHVEYALERVNKITFEAGNINVVRQNQTTDMFPLADLQWINFTQEVTGIDEAEPFAKGMLTAYPNPVSHTLTVSLSDLQNAHGNISIISVDGRLVKSIATGLSETVTIDMSTLPKGLYLLRHQSHSGDTRIVKIIKQ